MRWALVTALCVLASAPAAHATDASIKAAWDADDAQFAKLGKQQQRAGAAWGRSGFKESGPLLRIIATTRRLAAANTKAVAAQPESTPTGSRAKRYALASNSSFDRYLVLSARGVRLGTAGKTRASDHRFASARRYNARSRREARAAKKLFARVL